MQRYGRTKRASTVEARIADEVAYPLQSMIPPDSSAYPGQAVIEAGRDSGVRLLVCPKQRLLRRRVEELHLLGIKAKLHGLANPQSECRISEHTDAGPGYAHIE